MPLAACIANSVTSSQPIYYGPTLLFNIQEITLLIHQHVNQSVLATTEKAFEQIPDG